MVEVRSKEEILKTLDRKGQLNGLPFMPQMFEFCGGDCGYTSEPTRLATRSTTTKGGGWTAPCIWRESGAIGKPTEAAKPPV